MRFLIPMTVGAIIGYFTNWLAIKMLFRPYEEKRIFGMRVPFTPGLIPKERHRVARSVGNTVGEYLLTPETLMEVMKEDKVKNSIADLFKSILEKEKDNENKIGQLLENIGFDMEEVKNKVKLGLSNFVIEELNKEETRNKLYDLTEGIYDDNKDLLVENIGIYGDKYIRENILSASGKERLNKYVYEKLENYEDDDRQLIELIPEDLLKFIDEKIENNKYNIVLYIRRQVNKDDIKNNISEAIRNSVGGIPFASDIIAKGLMTALYEYINSRSGEELVYSAIDNIREDLYRKEIKEVVKLIDANFEDNLDEVFVLFKDILDNNNYIEDFLDYIKTRTNKGLETYKGNIVDHLNESINTLINSREFRLNLESTIYKFIDRLLSIRIKDLAVRIDEKALMKIKDIISKIIDSLNYELIVEFIELLDISSIVEEQINSFDIDFAEELILEIAGKELKAITNLGAFLGGLLGLLTPLMQLLS